MAEERSNITQADIDQIRWFHEFDLGNGLRAFSHEPDVRDHRRIWQFIEKQVRRLDLKGKTVLDIGCFDGYFSFLAERLGAKSVLAADDFSQNWSDSQGLRMAKQLLGSSVEINDHLNVYDVGWLDQTFDVIFCLGVYYHLIDPFYALAQLRQVCHADSVVLFEGDLWLGGSRSLARYQPGESRHPAFLPNFQAMEAMLGAAYFRIESVEYLRPANPLKNFIKRMLGRECKERVVIKARPFAGHNPAHEYPPPFGLAQYFTS